MAFTPKAKKTSLQYTSPENLDNKEESEGDIKGSNLHGKQKKITSPELNGKMGIMEQGRRGEEGRRAEKNIYLNKKKLKKTKK